jgi:hypothetical protein
VAVQTEEVRKYIHKRNNINNTKHSKYKHTYYQNTTHYKTHAYTNPHVTVQVETNTIQVTTTTVQDIPG